jgi:hypothetical protein
MKIRDEQYVINLCDRLLRMKARRQHRFEFLRGDPGNNGKRSTLPVDAFYPELNLVIEYREIQHSKPVTIFDERLTCSGCTRGEQRKRYDRRREVVLRRRGIRLLKLDYNMFICTSRNRLGRNKKADETIISQQLEKYLGGGPH